MEWLTDARLNVVFRNPSSSLRALHNLGRPYRNDLQRLKAAEEYSSLQSKGISTEQLNSLSWRVGMDTKKGSTLYLRRATSQDNKQAYKSERKNAQEMARCVYIPPLENHSQPPLSWNMETHHF